MNDFRTGKATNELAREVVSLGKELGLTVATAESLTAGLIAATLAQIPGSSAVLQGGVISYSNEVKAQVLGVSETLLATHGSVDGEVARAMAVGAQARCQSSVAVSATGVAGPDPHDGKDVGTVFLGYAHEAGSGFVEYCFAGTREEIRNQSTDAALTLLLSTLRSETPQVDAAM
ncbi:damage-inducible protein CinA [Arthrobacter sp. MYb227]|uniref:CinA family protein n=1 Tax=Arthrobacter sp. MYb227 TaxID=1848601 RepID=UPI000CFBA322|nr:CinA family protein [Arthrobacter sp. MYb227]PQZ92841.1 damage-inducible protein CinA [Arthrobacter sp. MYb227]